MLLTDHSQSARLDSLLLAYLNQGVAQPLKLANSGLPLLYWQFEQTNRWEAGLTTAAQSLTRHGSGLNGIAAYLIREGRPATQAAGPVAMCRGRSLADDSYQAVRAIPVYQAERLRQSCFTAVLASLAHLKTYPGDGWREYDEKVLTAVANYDGPAN